MNDIDSSTHDHGAKKHKKKQKKHKKEKKHKHKSDTRKTKEHKIIRECQDTVSIPNADPAESNEFFGPALPPNLQPNAKCDEKNQMIGPILPEEVKLNTNSDEISEVDEDDVVGPLPNNDALHSMTTGQIALEQRALEIKLSKFDNEKYPVDTTTREEWMLELPDVGLKSGLSSLKRTFRTKELPDFSDRSCWTKTPNSSEGSSTSKAAEDSKSLAVQLHQAARDAEQEKTAKKLKKAHKREESLYEMHQKKLKKERKEKEASGKEERRPFSRDVDLQLNKIDKSRTKAIVDKSKFLGSRFSAGNTKYL